MINRQTQRFPLCKSAGGRTYTYIQMEFNFLHNIDRNVFFFFLECLDILGNANKQFILLTINGFPNKNKAKINKVIIPQFAENVYL